jgi:hypothetical protein
MHVANWNLSLQRTSVAAVGFYIFNFVQPEDGLSNAGTFIWVAPKKYVAGYCVRLMLHWILLTEHLHCL